MKNVFHLSLPNLLRTILGRGVVSSTEAACLKFNDGKSTILDLNMNKTSLGGMQYDKRAMAISKTSNGVTSNGFVWDDVDLVTTKWRPQGITTHHTFAKRYVLISWYGRADEEYENRGGRISFVDISQMYQCKYNNCSYPYVHVLLVDANFCTLPNIHVGGIEQHNGILYVADSRKGMQRILQFDLEYDLYEVPSKMIGVMFGHHYMLRQSASFASPIKPSFLSFDADNQKFVIGTYARCGPKVGIHLDSESCFTQSKNQLVWFDSNNSMDVNNTILLDQHDLNMSCWHYFSEMQGATSARVHNDTIVWVSSSYGPLADSHLHVVNVSTFTGDCSSSNLDGLVQLDRVTAYKHPPGLEDLHIEHLAEKRLLWMTTEFGSRMVFSSSLEDLLPST
jgi:hypothetical protein